MIKNGRFILYIIKLSVSDRGVIYYIDLKYGMVIMYFNNNM